MPFSPRLLLNAEAFGFGPAAAVAAFAPQLRPLCCRLAYAGTGHSLDLQRGLPYDEIHDMSGRSEADWRALLRKHDVLLTALDGAVAALAVEEGLRVAIWDPLAWYWTRLPAAAAAPGSLYLVQDFFGVRERLEAESFRLADARIVPPLVAAAPPARVPSDILLLNLGGLANPFWTAETTAAYARAMLAGVRAAMPDGLRLVGATSAAVAAALGDPAVACRTPSEMARLLGCAAIVAMTPGLGNMLDAARHGLPTLWLPPANDSQARQIALLEREGLSDAAVAWADIGETIDAAAPQPDTMRRIAQAVGRLHADAEGRLARAFEAPLRHLARRRPSAAGGLLDRFGADGAAAVARHVADWLQEIPCPQPSACPSPSMAASASTSKATFPCGSTAMPS